MRADRQSLVLALSFVSVPVAAFLFLMDGGPYTDGVDPTANYRRFEDPFLAARYGDLESLQGMLERRPDLLRETDRRGLTLLHYAALGDHSKVAEYLISKGADVDARTNLGRTPLYAAADSGNLEVAKVLAYQGADVNARASQPLSDVDAGDDDNILSAAAGSGNLKLVKWLLDKGAKVEYGRGETRNTALHWAAHGVYNRRDDQPHKPYKLSNAAIIDLLAKHIGDINVRDGFGYTPLHRAAQSGAVTTVEHILETYPEVNVNARNHEAETPLEVAVYEPIGAMTSEDYAAIVELLIDHGAKREKRNGRGEWLFDWTGEPTSPVILKALGMWRAVEAPKPE